MKREEIKNAFAKFGFLDPNLLNRICDTVQVESFKRRQTIVRKGSVSDRVYLILSGVIVISTDVNGKTTTPWILTAGDFVIAPDGFFQYTNTIYELRAAVNTEVVSLSKAEYDEIAAEYPALAGLSNVIQLHYRTIKDKRENNFRIWDGERRFEWFWDTYRDLVGIIEQKDIYTFLGMSRNWYTKFKNSGYKIIRRNRKM